MTSVPSFNQIGRKLAKLAYGVISQKIEIWLVGLVFIGKIGFRKWQIVTLDFIMPPALREDKLDVGYISLNNAVIRTCESALGF